MTNETKTAGRDTNQSSSRVSPVSIVGYSLRAPNCSCVILERGEDGYACVHGSGTNSDGATPEGITYPSSKMQAELMKEVFHASDIDPRSVSYHEAHAEVTNVNKVSQRSRDIENNEEDFEADEWW
eukprot:CAMPEP_0198257652 /NCGR_PEP_ID=MMETSP1447-20131203/7268_1 /TAXON_ID=420782 /ORGANISM="Chaetoceros dichaeta, Strain CCMP1751" /LENGTH=125 /DNA_ID=CAMNT_0043944597 /DNA_START=84 /DNA_END=461 /DNA_ORIENTATION=+